MARAVLPNPSRRTRTSSNHSFSVPSGSRGDDEGTPPPRSLTQVFRTLVVAGVSAAAVAIASVLVPSSSALGSDQLSSSLDLSPVGGFDLSYLWTLQLVQAPPTPPALPASPQEALVRSIANLSSMLGFSQNVSAQVAVAGLSDEIAGHLARALDAVSACTTITKNVVSTRSFAELASEAAPPMPDVSAQLRECAAPLYAAGLALSYAVPATTESSPPGPELDVWPVIAYRGSFGHDTYVHDYAVVVDTGGADTYENNAGGNLLDLKRGPVGSPATLHEHAKGCNHTVNDSVDGACDPAAVLLVDKAGNDQYGYFQQPLPGYDLQCGTQPVVHRTVTAGAALIGAAVLIDDQGNDEYLTRTVAAGTGHTGVGILRDKAGNDRYLSSRNGIGESLIGGAGLLYDDSGNDRYELFMPAGGLVDGSGTCDREGRYLQGVGVDGGEGVLVDAGGNDLYIAPPPSFRFQFDAIPAATGSQGFGELGGVGVLLDESGDDEYEGMGGSRGDGVTLVSTPPGTDLAPRTGIGVFRDR